MAHGVTVISADDVHDHLALVLVGHLRVGQLLGILAFQLVFRNAGLEFDGLHLDVALDVGVVGDHGGGRYVAVGGCGCRCQVVRRVSCGGVVRSGVG